MAPRQRLCGYLPRRQAGFLKDKMHKRTVKNGTKPSLRKLSACVGAYLAVLLLALAVLILVFGGAILNRYGKRKAERAFAEAYPGFVLRIGAAGLLAGRQSPDRSICHSDGNQEHAQG